VNFYKNFLGYILGILGIAQNPQAGVVNPVLEVLYKVAKGFLVSFL
jgi:hypothetical protein